ncbi:MAG: hypothetical protein LBV55_03095 [Acholeplasmatales bacterium]|jgi:hypothetical protein|nr:hypothetical protein [Acholeplasmatales bacterium]
MENKNNKSFNAKLTVLGIVSILYFFISFAVCISAGISVIPVLTTWGGSLNDSLESALTSIFSLILVIVVWAIAMFVIFGLGSLLSLFQLIVGIKKLKLRKQAYRHKVLGYSLGSIIIVFDFFLIICGFVLFVLGLVFASTIDNDAVIYIGLSMFTVFLFSAVLDIISRKIFKGVIKENEAYLEELRNNANLTQK